jgi:hypothetical protein
MSLGVSVSGYKTFKRHIQVNGTSLKLIYRHLITELLYFGTKGLKNLK